MLEGRGKGMGLLLNGGGYNRLRIWVSLVILFLSFLQFALYCVLGIPNGPWNALLMYLIRHLESLGSLKQSCPYSKPVFHNKLFTRKGGLYFVYKPPPRGIKRPSPPV